MAATLPGFSFDLSSEFFALSRQLLNNPKTAPIKEAIFREMRTKDIKLLFLVGIRDDFFAHRLKSDLELDEARVQLKALVPEAPRFGRVQSMLSVAESHYLFYGWDLVILSQHLEVPRVEPLRQFWVDVLSFAPKMRYLVDGALPQTADPSR